MKIPVGTISQTPGPFDGICLGAINEVCEGAYEGLSHQDIDLLEVNLVSYPPKTYPAEEEISSALLDLPYRAAAVYIWIDWSDLKAAGNIENKKEIICGELADSLHDQLAHLDLNGFDARSFSSTFVQICREHLNDSVERAHPLEKRTESGRNGD